MRKAWINNGKLVGKCGSLSADVQAYKAPHSFFQVRNLVTFRSQRFIMATNHAPRRVPTMMKPFLSSALSLALLFSTLVAGPARAAEGGKEKAVQNSPASEADGKAYAAAEALYSLARYAEAEKAALALVAARAEALGAEARETLRARLLLAEALRMQAKDAEAEPQLRTLLPVMEKVFGAEDRETLRCQSALLALTAGQDKRGEAEKEFRSLIATASRVLGTEDPVTLMTRRRLAGLWHMQGKLAEAETEIRQVLAICQRTPGAEDCDTLHCQFHLIVLLAAQSKDAEVEAECRSLIPL
ncbi:MAG: hypothetical protein JWR15_1404 [Prosthecobacter sp.]|nr:hypothetical protein [Prosthecobacter sp.]